MLWSAWQLHILTSSTVSKWNRKMHRKGTLEDGLLPPEGGKSSPSLSFSSSTGKFSVSSWIRETKLTVSEYLLPQGINIFNWIRSSQQVYMYWLSPVYWWESAIQRVWETSDIHAAAKDRRWDSNTGLPAKILPLTHRKSPAHSIQLNYFFFKYHLNSLFVSFVSFMNSKAIWGQGPLTATRRVLLRLLALWQSSQRVILAGLRITLPASGRCP